MALSLFFEPKKHLDEIPRKIFFCLLTVMVGYFVKCFLPKKS